MFSVCVFSLEALCAVSVRAPSFFVWRIACLPNDVFSSINSLVQSRFSFNGVRAIALRVPSLSCNSVLEVALCVLSRWRRKP